MIKVIFSAPVTKPAMDQMVIHTVRIVESTSSPQAAMSNGISQLNLCDFVVDKSCFQMYSYIIHLRSTL